MTSLTLNAQDNFQVLTAPYRQELLLHCYRMLGSLEDAEDALQETLLRAWRRLDTLKAQSALRAWLYRIATHVSLDMLETRKPRSLPTLHHAPLDASEAPFAPVSDPIWLEPLPDEYLPAHGLDPQVAYEIRERVTLAFLAALQELPGRQRAILILRDVLDWRAQEVADLLGLTVIAVNSALQRARTTMRKYHYDQAFYTVRQAADPQTATLLARYMHAWETADTPSLISTLREDAILTMPPSLLWYRGRSSIQTFLDRHLFHASLHLRLLATQANGCPAFAVYGREDQGIYRPLALQVLTLAGEQIAQIDDFLVFDSQLFSRFKLPLTLA